MGTKMTHTARAELTNVVRRRYGAATGAKKRSILDEFIAVTGYHQKSAIRALNAEPIAKRRQTRVRPSLYDEAARAALIVLWEASDRVCGKRLRALLPILLPALERNGHLHLDEPMRQKILAMSASTGSLARATTACSIASSGCPNSCRRSTWALPAASTGQAGRAKISPKAEESTDCLGTESALELKLGPEDPCEGQGTRRGGVGAMLAGARRA